MGEEKDIKKIIAHDWHWEIIARLLANGFEVELTQKSVNIFEIFKSKSREYNIERKQVYKTWYSGELFNTNVNNLVILNEIFREIDKLLTDEKYPLLDLTPNKQNND